MESEDCCRRNREEQGVNTKRIVNGDGALLLSSGTDFHGGLGLGRRGIPLFGYGTVGWEKKETAIALESFLRHMRAMLLRALRRRG